MTKILMLGDVTSPAAAARLAAALPSYRAKHGIDLVVVNAENAGFIIGPTPDTAKLLLGAGADVLTGGNHTMQNYSLLSEIDDMPAVLRPANYPAAAPGAGSVIVKTAQGVRVLVVSLLGRVHIEPALNSPFEAVDRILERHRGRYDLAVVDFHAEATAEKLAMGHYLDGRATVVVGTHTHVPTADLGILPGGTGYVTDLGMCGPCGSILGIDPADVIDRYLTAVNHRFHPAEGKIQAEGAVFEIEDGKCRAASRVCLSLD